ncbi:MAG TPA: DNA topoisomerase IB [Xanthobacteraceae bacterium]|nr:DNA topoisomerase IB [Xanthobacteraceae bacterium]
MSLQDHGSEEKSRTTAPRDRPALPASTMRLVKRLGLTYIDTAALTIKRQRHGRGFRYLAPSGKTVRAAEAKRLASLAVPPAYDDVLYAADPTAHIQATGRDAAGRLQYRYHPGWQHVRETRKARRLARLAEALPKIRRSIGHHLAGKEPTRSFTLSAVIELVARSAIRPGTEQYAKLRGTRGAATLLKSNVTVYGETVNLRFRAKGAKQIDKDIHAPKLAAAIDVLRQLPGRRLFQYRSDAGDLRAVSAQDVNLFLREIAGVEISLKDFRTLLASVSVLEALARAEPATTERARRRQVVDAICEAAAELGNTPAICRKSYVHETVVNAFEDGVLEQFAETLRASRSTARGEQILAKVAAQMADRRPEPV